MQIILLDKVVNLGNLGEIVKVKDGYARNFLIPSGRARRATAAAKAEFEAKRAELEKEAQTAAVDLDKAAALHSAAFEKWRDAKTVAHNFTIPYGNFTSSGAPAFPAGAGFTASASLHPEIRRDLARLAFPNSTGSVANPRVG